MCIICVKNGKRLPTLEQVKNCWNNNPDGAGIFWYNPNRQGDNKIGYKKGFFDEASFVRFWQRISKDYKLAGFHCRIATHGGIKASLCHPFPVDRVNNKQLSGYVSKLAVHNGVLSENIYKNYFTSADSDTSAYCKKIYLEMLSFETIRKETAGSRFVIITKTGGLHLFGGWRYEDGVFYSNDSYSYKKTYNYKFTSYGNNQSYNSYNWKGWSTAPKKQETTAKESPKATGKDSKIDPELPVIDKPLKYYGMGYDDLGYYD